MRAEMGEEPRRGGRPTGGEKEHSEGDKEKKVQALFGLGGPPAMLQTLFGVSRHTQLRTHKRTLATTHPRKRQHARKATLTGIPPGKDSFGTDCWGTVSKSVPPKS